MGALGVPDDPSLPPELFTAGRAEAVQRVRGWLTGSPACLRVQADTADEVFGFVAAVARSLDPGVREAAYARAILIRTPDAWRAVAGGQTPCHLLTASPDLGSDTQAVARGHHVLIAYGNDAAGVRADAKLGPLKRSELETALRAMGLGRDRVAEVAAESRGRLAAVVDLLDGGTQRPPWAAPDEASALVPLLLAGAWCQTPGDLEAVGRLGLVSADEVSRRAVRWANDTDPPVRLVAGMWDWVSRRRAWPHLGRFVTAADLTALRQVASEVVGEIDPRLSLPADERWMAAIRGRVPRYSEPLRRGLAEALAILASLPRAATAGPDPVPAVVRSCFGPAPDPDRWRSLAPVLPHLAEADPDHFLTVVERDVVGNAAVRAAVFHEPEFGGGVHCHVLWALETIAWSPEFLPRVALVLGGLAANDPGGRTGNRPATSLSTIFLPWSPHNGDGRSASDGSGRAPPPIPRSCIRFAGPIYFRAVTARSLRRRGPAGGRGRTVTRTGSH